MEDHFGIGIASTYESTASGCARPLPKIFRKWTMAGNDEKGQLGVKQTLSSDSMQKERFDHQLIPNWPVKVLRAAQLHSIEWERIDMVLVGGIDTTC